MASSPRRTTQLGADHASAQTGSTSHDYDGTTVDSFWLHLTVETGVLGLTAYVVWLWLLAVPLLGVTRRYVNRKVWGAPGPAGPTDATAAAAALWGLGGTDLHSRSVGAFPCPGGSALPAHIVRRYQHRLGAYDPQSNPAG